VSAWLAADLSTAAIASMSLQMDWTRAIWI